MPGNENDFVGQHFAARKYLKRTWNVFNSTIYFMEAYLSFA